MSLGGRCRAVWVIIFETGRALAFVMFEGGWAINLGAIHPELLIPTAGLEPTPSCEDRILSLVRLPYRNAFPSLAGAPDPQAGWSASKDECGRLAST